MEIGSSSFATQGTVASDTAPYYLPSGVTSFGSITVTDLSVTENASVNNNLLVNGVMYGNIVTPSITYNNGAINVYGSEGVNITGAGSGGMFLTSSTDTNINSQTGSIIITTETTGDIALTATTGGVTISASADTGTSVFRRFGLFDCLGSPTSPATLSTAPYNMPTSKGFFQGTAGDSGVYVFNVNPSFNPNPFAIIQSIDGSPTNVSGWSITGPGQITVTGPGGSQVAKFSIIIL